MIDKKELTAFLERRLEGTDYFPVEVRVSPSNEIKIEIDSMSGVDIDFCVELSREIEQAFPREPEDYELEVGSAGLTSPFKVLKQYEKNIGKKVEILTADGKKLRGELLRADADSFAVEITEKVKPEGAKRPVERKREITFAYPEVKSVVYDIDF